GSKYAKAFTVNGSKLELASRELAITLPGSAMNSYFTVESDSVVISTSGGETLTGLAIGDIGETDSGAKVTIDSITGTCAAGSGACTPATYEDVVPLGQNLIYTDQSAPSGRVVIVGGYLVNSLAVGLTLNDGTTLEDALQVPGDYVAEKLSNGDMVAAGMTASDTITAAQELIDALTALMG
ncbi:hypothetical protein KKE06_02885, partial [Candidatus Micrarchaeota archaeon]|nr:hypothetical protein [Candidatus Micrarchaeota archaeon]MBU1930401.1 hypothetical protein [Candidatus Micrarchaeota archaeon]